MAAMPIASSNAGDVGDSEAIRTERPDVFLCRECGLLQILGIVDADLQYATYQYTTNVSMGLAEHFQRLADYLENYANLKRDAFVVEIGSNDGTLLRFFKDGGARVLGVDPAAKIAEQATNSGIPTLPRFFNETLGRQIRDEYGAADLVISNNVIANLDDMADLASGVRALMTPESVFVFETQYGLEVLRKTLLDVIYFEHLSYFTVKPLIPFFEHHGMQVVDAEKISPKGGSLRVFAQRAAGSHTVSPNVAALIREEEEAGLYGQEIYDAFSGRINQIRQALHDMIAAHKDRGGKIAVYGASVGCVALIYELDLLDRLDVIFDDMPFKDVIPGSRKEIAIRPGSELEEFDPSLVIVLAWRYVDPIVGRHQDYVRKGGVFVSPLPEVHEV